MNARDRWQIEQVLHSRRDAIAEDWHRAIAWTSFRPLNAPEVRRCLAELTEQVITVLLAEPFEPRRAETIGASLARLHYAQPETLGNTQKVLTRQIVEGLPADLAQALQPCMAALLGGMAAGFLQQARETILAEQERIRRALDARRREAEEALRESEQVARALLNALHDPALLMDPDGVIVALNEAAAKQLDKNGDELAGMRLYDLLPPDVAERRKDEVDRVVLSGRSARSEDERGGRWFDHVVYPVFDAQGKVRNVAALGFDITERKRTEQALRNSEARYRAISELISNFAYAISVGPDGEVAYEWVTEPFVHITGFTPGETTARGGWLTIVHPDDAPVANQHVQTLLSGQPDVSEFRIVTKADKVRWIRDYGRPVWGERPRRVTRIFGAAQDISDRKHMEQQLLRAERLTAMGRLAAALAHEVNNPLQAIRSNLELVLDFDLEPAENEEYLHVVRQEIERLAEITKHVLNFAHPPNDTRYPVKIDHLMQETLALVDVQLHHAHVQVTTDFPTDLPPAFVAPNQIIQVLLNLTINAIDAMPSGGRLHVTARVDRGMVVVSLTNDGPPIPSAEIDRIFEPFFTTKPTGTGLGLAVSDSIVRKHGGTIRVENLRDEQGVAFVITLPISRSVKR